MEDFRSAWKQRANSKQITAADHFERCILLAVRAKTNEDRKLLAYRYLTRAFTPITNKSKLENGAKRWEAIFQAAWPMAIKQMKWDHSKIRNASEELKELRTWLGAFCTDDEYDQALHIARVIWNEASRNSVYESPYSYFFVRQDISPEQQLVQTAHAAQKLGWALRVSELVPNNEYDDLHFVVIGCKDLEDLNQALLDYTNLGIKCIEFHEPDMRNELTSFVTHPLKGTERTPFKNEKLLTFSPSVGEEAPVTDAGREAA